VKLSKNIAAHTRNRSPLKVTEGKIAMDRYLSPKLHSSKFENPKILVPTLKNKVYVTFPEVVPNINRKVVL